jgi:uncharacterized membrane protein YphA (DoxX/SURF4 family)
LGIQDLAPFSKLQPGLFRPKKYEGHLPQRLFFGFPRGLPGIALLLLRAVVGVLLLVQGAFYVGEQNPTIGTLLVGLTALAGGILLLVGFLTPIIGTLVGLGALCIRLSVLPVPAPNLLDGKLPAIQAAAMLIAVVILGPGAFSVDSRVFGRREVIIPSRPPR